MSAQISYTFTQKQSASPLAGFTHIDTEERERILIVENSAALRKSFVKSLSARYRCTEAASVAQALEHLSKKEFAVVVTDTSLPGLSGIELLRKVVENHPYTSIIVISENNQPQRALDAVRLGAFDYLIKPLEVPTLELNIERALEQRRLLLNTRQYKMDLEIRNNELARRTLQLEEAIQQLADLSIAVKRESQEWMKTIFDGSRDGIIIENNKKSVYVNKSFARLFGFEETDELIGKPVETFLPPEGSEMMIEYGAHHLGTKHNPSVYEFKGKRQDGSLVDLEAAVSKSTVGGKKYIMTACRDITERKKADTALRESEYKLRTLLQNMSEGLVQVNNEYVIEFVNDRFCEMTGYTREELLDNFSFDLFLEGETKKMIEQINQQRLRGISGQYELQLKSKSGELFWVNAGGTPIINAGGEVTGTMGIFIDITERKRAEAQLLFDALHDGLTGLANRTLFMDYLRLTIARSKRKTDTRFAVLFLDFDRFKVINDSLGHVAGDELLKQIAARLKEMLRPGDLIARLGGDEFTILLDELGDESDALRIAERIQEDLKKPFDLEGRQIFTSASIGIALSSSGQSRAEDMLRDADNAMYRAKAKGKAQYQVFDQGMHQQALKQLQLETEMRQALERKEFCVYYQPIMDLETYQPVGFEALLRWKHPERGMISPLEFVPAAEENRLILPLGRWILQESCRQLREWQDKDPLAKNLAVSVNLSSKQFLQPDLAEQIASILVETGVSPRCLKLEVTESHIMENAEVAVSMINRLRDVGIEISLDDFGTGYSSLSYLHRLPVDYLKIDRSFVNRMASEENAEIVHTIIKLGQNLKMKVVAEGIETSEQLAQLKRLNCEYGQGYFFSKPLESEQAFSFITETAKSAPPQEKEKPEGK